MSTRGDSSGSLTALGLDAAEQAAYELLVTRPAATLADLAGTWSAPEHLADVLAALIARGLVRVEPGPDVRFTAVAPTMAFQALLHEREAQVDAARRHLSVLDGLYWDRPDTRFDPNAVEVEVVTGHEAMYQRLIQIRHGARQQVRCLVKPPYLESCGEVALRSGVVCQAVYEGSSLHQPGAMAAVEKSIGAGQQVRILPQLPVTMCLVDDRLAFVPLARRDAAAIVYPSVLLGAFIKLFEESWRRALPLHASAGGPAAEREHSAAPSQQRLVRLLLSGLTDEAIARQFGLSYRSIQRRVAALMAELGAHTRFQAGVQAALRGVPRTTPGGPTKDTPPTDG